MQTEAPAEFDISKRAARRLASYTASVYEPTDDYARRCLLAAGLVEKGVRFVGVVSGGGPGDKQWDAHDDIEENHLRMAVQTDKPVAGLLADLKRRGLLDSTLYSGAANSAARRNARAAKAGTTIISALRCGWPAEELKAGKFMALPTKSACVQSENPATSATFTPQFLINSGSIRMH